MIKKEDILKKIKDAQEVGITKKELYGKNELNNEAIDKIIEELISEGKVFEENGRIYIEDNLAKGLKREVYAKREELKNYATKAEVKELLQEVFYKITQLKEEINRLYDYVDDVFIDIRKKESTIKSEPTLEELLIIYENLNTKYHFEDSVPLPIFKKEVEKHFKISGSKVDEILMELDKKEVIYLREIDKNKKIEDKEKGITIEGKLFYYLTWVKK